MSISGILFLDCKVEIPENGDDNPGDAMRVFQGFFNAYSCGG
jgi:hypothetical protein